MLLKQDVLSLGVIQELYYLRLSIKTIEHEHHIWGSL